MMIINTQISFLSLEFANTKVNMNQSLVMRIRLCELETRNNNSNNNNNDDKELSLPL